MGNTPTVTGFPLSTLYHRWLGWHVPAMRRALTVLGVDGKVVEFWGSSTDQCVSDELIGRPGGNVTGVVTLSQSGADGAT